jgi:hypothetical protein
MGQEIAYCADCGSRLRSADFEKGGAFRIELQSFCKACAPAAVKSLPPEKIQAILVQSAPPKESKSRRSPSEVDAAGAYRAARLLTERAESSNFLLAGIGVALVAGLVLMGIFLAGGSDRASLKSDSRLPEARGAAPPDMPEAYRIRSAEVAAGPAPEELALAALRAARDYVKQRPEDVPGQTALYSEALRLSKGTRHAALASAELESLQKKQQDRMGADLAAIDEQVALRRAEEAFGAALDILEKEWGRHLDAGWTRSLGERVRRITEEAENRYSTLEAKVLSAKRAGDEQQLRQLSDRITRWNVPKISAALEKALASVAREIPLAPAIPKEAQLWQARWEAAMALARDRDFAASIRAIEEALPEIKEAALRREALDDQALLRLGAAALDESVRALSSLPKGSRVALKYSDESGASALADGIVLRSGPYQMEISQNKETVLVLFGELSGASLAEILKFKPGRPSGAEGPSLALLCLLDGDEAAARKELPPASRLAEKYYGYARKMAAGDPRRAPRDVEARRLFFQAERESIRPESASQGAARCKALLQTHLDTSFVRRNASAIAARSELGKEFFYLASDLGAGGTFKASTHEKAKACWTSASDSEASRLCENYLELAFPQPAAGELRVWIYVGGCCAETTAFAVQITELVAPHPQTKQPVAMEPGGELAMPVKQSLATTRTHASHGGPKQASRWGWVQIPLPKFSAPGLKKVRVVTRQQGFSVGFALVSSARQSAPREAELAELERQRTDALLRFGGPQANAAGLANPADVLIRGDFKNVAAVQSAWIVSQGEFPIRFDGQLEIELSGDPNGRISELIERVPHELPIRVSVDVEISGGPKGVLAGLRLHCYQGDITKVIHADIDGGRYSLYGNKTPTANAEAPGAGSRRERWTIELGRDGGIVWLIEGKEILRSTRETGDDAYRVILSSRARPGIDAGAKVRFGNLTVERLNH